MKSERQRIVHRARVNLIIEALSLSRTRIGRAFKISVIREPSHERERERERNVTRMRERVPLLIKGFQKNRMFEEVRGRPEKP